MAESSRIDDLRHRVQNDPASIAFAQLAEELRRAGRLEEAVQTCRAGLAIHPGYLSARVTLGRALVELDQLDDAAGELELVLSTASENLAALRAMAEIQRRRGHLVDALATYRAALALARNDPDLEETVADLSRSVEPKPLAASDDQLSQSEFLQHLPKPPARPVAGDADRPAAQSVFMPEPSGPASAPRSGQPPQPVAPEPAGRDRSDEIIRASRQVTALEQWLDAIHGPRSDRSA